MSDFKGTPGPWSCAYNGYFFDIKPKGSCQDLAITHANEHIGIDKVIEEANANLIAAAPELLEALQLFADEEVMAQLNGSEFVDPVDDEEWVKFRFVAKDFRKAAAAIAKALGQ